VDSLGLVRPIRNGEGQQRLVSMPHEGTGRALTNPHTLRIS
jgi:hypothetical protein